MATLDDCNPTVGMAIKLAYSTVSILQVLSNNNNNNNGYF